MQDAYRICTRCVMDSTDPDIKFDSLGQCNHCSTALETLKRPPFGLDLESKASALKAYVDRIKKAGKGKRYDCIIGLSGGVDSSYLAWLVKKQMGLRPLAVHLDNGWDSEISVSNIENICRKLDIDLYTHVIDWEEFKELQLAFLRASTPDTEIVSDHAIVTVMYDAAMREGLKYVIGGTNYATESIMAPAWSRGHADWKYIRSVNRIFGKRGLSTYPHRSFMKHISHKLGWRIQWFDALNYIDYDKEKAKRLIASELGWKDYGRKHGESNFTRIFQEIILPDKFGYDKRRGHLSSLIVAGQMTREEALKILEQPLYTDAQTKKSDVNYLCSKLGISMGQYDEIMALEPKTIFDYPSYARSWLIQAFWKLVSRIRNI